ncbi:Protein of unknown function [Cotesia congregata]|uniref:Peptidase A2 domain-containing protein n=1 Tax=Cotesia congregata TaxID=51543 RepID=A0A8J2HIQ2_COTCN|nr:Protein of unknown function [Cotesia congregata]
MSQAAHPANPPGCSPIQREVPELDSRNSLSRTGGAHYQPAMSSQDVWTHMKGTTDSYDVLCHALRERFGEPDIECRLLGEVVNRTQGPLEAGLDYLDSLLAIWALVSEPLPVRLQLNFAYNNLRSEYHVVIHREDFSTFGELYRLVRDYDRPRRRMQPRTPVTPNESVMPKLAYQPDRYLQRTSNKTARAQVAAIEDNDRRPFVNVQIGGRTIKALLDTGASVTCIKEVDERNWVYGLGARVRPTNKKTAAVADGSVMAIHALVTLPLVINDEMRPVEVRVIPKLNYDMILGMDAIAAFEICYDGQTGRWWTKRTDDLYDWNSKAYLDGRDVAAIVEITPEQQNALDELLTRRSFERQARYYNRHHRDERFAVGDVVRVRQHVLSRGADRFSSKLARKYSEETYTVSTVISPVVYELADQTGRPAGRQHVKALRLVRAPLRPPDPDD